MIIDEDGYEMHIDKVKALTLDMISHLTWKTKEGVLIRIGDMADNHLRNTALMLMGFGFQKYNVPDDLKIAWLTAFRMEWERRMLTGKKIMRG